VAHICRWLATSGAVARIGEPWKGKYGLRDDIDHRRNRFRFWAVYLFVRGNKELAEPNGWAGAGNVIVSRQQITKRFPRSNPAPLVGIPRVPRWRKV